MAFFFAYSLDGDGTSVVKDFPLDTLTNYQAGTGANGVKKGDLVKTAATGLTQKVVVADLTGVAIGSCEGGEFTGLIAQGQPYAATNSSFIASSINTTRNPNGIGKVRANKSDTIYKVNVKSGQTAAVANVGGKYGIAIEGTGDQVVDISGVYAGTTTSHVKVVDYTPDGKFVFVQLL